MSDVFGSMVKQYHLDQTADQADWLIGAEILTSNVQGIALRSMKDPGTAFDDPILGKDPQFAHYSQVLANPYPLNFDDGGVHIYSGVPNRAFYLVATTLGGYSWDRAGKIWYAALLSDSLKADADFHAFATLTWENAELLFDKTVQSVVEQAWRDVGVELGGIDPETEPEPEPGPGPEPEPGPLPPRKTVSGTWSGIRSRSALECTFVVSGTTVQGHGLVTINGQNAFTIVNGYTNSQGEVRFTAKFDFASDSTEESCRRQAIQFQGTGRIRYGQSILELVGWLGRLRHLSRTFLSRLEIVRSVPIATTRSRPKATAYDLHLPEWLEIWPDQNQWTCCCVHVNPRAIVE